MLIGCLVDTTRCIGCRSCQAACKQANGLAAEDVRPIEAVKCFPAKRRSSPRTFTYLTFHEVKPAAGRSPWVFVKRQCMHCTRLYCVEACSPQVYRRTESGVADYEPGLCIGCGACLDTCPFQVPAIDYWDLPTPQLRKCGFCHKRQTTPAGGLELDGRPLSSPGREHLEAAYRGPACAKACPTGAIKFGPRRLLLAEAHRRIAASPGRYTDHVYGEREAGGTAWLYLAAVPFAELGFPELTPAAAGPKPADFG